MTHRTRLAVAAAGLLLLSGCALTTPMATSALTAAGDKNAATQVADLNALGALACRAADGSWFSVVGANVVGASAAAVATTCAVAQPGAVPGPLPDSVVTKAVTVSDAVLQALAASKVAPPG